MLSRLTDIDSTTVDLVEVFQKLRLPFCLLHCQGPNQGSCIYYCTVQYLSRLAVVWGRNRPGEHSAVRMLRRDKPVTQDSYEIVPQNRAVNDNGQGSAYFIPYLTVRECLGVYEGSDAISWRIPPTNLMPSMRPWLRPQESLSDMPCTERCARWWRWPCLITHHTP